MKIRVLNQNDWEKNFDFDKSIVRVGSQLNCDIPMVDSEVRPLQMQFVRSGTENHYVMRYFADSGTLTRGDQQFTIEKVTPYDVVDGDKISFGNYRLIISLGNDRKRYRTTKHISAEMTMGKRELSPDQPINGYVTMHNNGTKKPCQFKMTITGIPEDCLQSAPLPYLHPGQSSSVGFVISHLNTHPSPGFHTVSITLSAPEQYFGELLEFNQDIYVSPVFRNDIILEDDSAALSGFNKSLDDSENEPVQDNTAVIPAAVQDFGLMNLQDQADDDMGKTSETVVKVTRNPNEGQDAFDSEPEEENNTSAGKNRKNRIVVIRHDEGTADAFDEEAAKSAPEPEPIEAPAPKGKKKEKRVRKERAAKKDEQPAEVSADDLQPDFPSEASPEDTTRKSAVKKAKTKNSPEPELIPTPEPENPVNPEPASDVSAADKPAEIPVQASEEEPSSPESTQADPDKTENDSVSEAGPLIPESIQADEPLEKPEQSEAETSEPAAPAAVPETVVPAEQPAEISLPETPAETAVREKRSGRKKETVLHISGGSSGEVPVVQSSGSFDFDDFDEPSPAPVEQKKEPVRFVKGGSFDD